MRCSHSNLSLRASPYGLNPKLKSLLEDSPGLEMYSNSALLVTDLRVFGTRSSPVLILQPRAYLLLVFFLYQPLRHGLSVADCDETARWEHWDVRDVEQTEKMVTSKRDFFAIWGYVINMRCVLQWLAQLALVAYLTQALLARTDLPMYATLATHDRHSLKKMMTASWTFIISAESCHIATWLSGARECSMISTIVKPPSAPTPAQPRTIIILFFIFYFQKKVSYNTVLLLDLTWPDVTRPGLAWLDFRMLQNTSEYFRILLYFVEFFGILDFV